MRSHLRDLAHAALVFAAASAVALVFMAAAGGYGLAVFLGVCLVPGLVVTAARR